MNNRRYFESGGREGPGPSRGGVDPKLLIPTESQIEEFIETLKGPEGTGKRRGVEERNYRPQDLVYRPYERSNSSSENQRSAYRSRSRSRSPDMRRSPRRDRRPSPSDRRDSRKRSADRLNEPAEDYQRSKYNEPVMPMMNFNVPQFTQGMMDPRMMTMNPLMTQQMMTQMMAMMPQMMGMMNPMMMQPFLAAAAAAQKIEAPVDEPPPPPRIKEKSPPIIDKNEWKNSSRIPTPPPPPTLSECKKATEKALPPKKKETDIISSLLENKDVSLSSLLEAAIEPKGSKRHIEDPVLKKKIVEQCETRISHLYKLKNSDGAFIPDPISKDRTEELNMLYNHPYLEFSCESKPVKFWRCPNVKVPEKKPLVPMAPKIKEIEEKNENESFSIETINREELIVPLNLPIQSHCYIPPAFPSPIPTLDNLPVPKVPPRMYERPEYPPRTPQPSIHVESSSDESFKKKKSKKKRKKRKRRRSRSSSEDSDSASEPKIVPPSYQSWNNPVPTPVPAPVPAPVPSPAVNPITHPWLKLDPVSKVKTPVFPPSNQTTQNERNLVAIPMNPVHQPPAQPMYQPPPVRNVHPVPVNPMENYGPIDYAPPHIENMPPNYIPPDTNFPPPNYSQPNFNPHASSFPPAHFPSASNFPPPGVPNFHSAPPNFPPPGGLNFPPPQNMHPAPIAYPPSRNQPPFSVRSGSNIPVSISSSPSAQELEAYKKQFQKVFAPISKVIEELRNFQESDSTCSGIKARLLSGRSSLTDVFTLYEGLLCRIEDYKRSSKCIQIVVPKTCVYKAIVAIHNSNHFLKEKMFEEILYECFYSLGDVQDLISSVFNKCEFCKKPAARSLSRERHQNEILSQRPGAIVLPKIKVNLKKKNNEERMDKNNSPDSFQKFTNDQFHFYRKQNKPKLYDDSETIDLTEQEKSESKMPNLDFKTRVRETQMLNETLKNMIIDLENDKPCDPSYILKGSMLCQKVNIDKNSVVRIVADLKHIREFCYIVHTMASIHAPYEKSLIIFKQHFIPIDGIDAILKNVVDSCETCQQI